MQTVHIRVNDAATGQPTPVRLRLTHANGTYHAPFGRLTEFATTTGVDVGGNLLLAGEPAAYIDGTCEARLTPGTIRVEVDKGPEYVPLREEIALAPGKLALRLTIKRWTDLRAQGWYSGDTRCHFLTPHAALLEAAAEDLAVVNLLAAEYEVPGPLGRTYQAISNILAFSGQQPALEMLGHLVVVNTHNIHPVLGSLGLLNCHRPVYPLRFGGPDGKDDWTLADWCDQCHRKGGLVVWTRPREEGSEESTLGEPLADLLLGKVDALEIDRFEDASFNVVGLWYELLTCGLRVPLVGASGKDSNAIALGGMRTYARLREGEAFSYRNWIEAVRAGRTFVTNGPLLTFTVNGCDPGTVLELQPGTRTVHVSAQARSIIPFDYLEVLVNGVSRAVAQAEDKQRSAAIETDVEVPADGWVATRCGGTYQLFSRPTPQRVFAHTSPVYFRRTGPSLSADTEWAARREEAAAYLMRHIDRMLDWVQNEARCDTAKQRDDLLTIFQSARQELLRRQGP
ncbi:MAG TPA: CehA/McbA family metallohydrolase [Gemmataceae bacterium]|nr:CehA/McbA family metallohydrolase [Gemmataceae bacterium]